MEIKVVSIKKNLLLKRKEVDFLVETKSKTKTPSRVDIKKNIADKLKIEGKLVFIKKMQTLTGSNITVGIANIYDTFKQANLIEANHIKKRNTPQEAKKEETKE
jgi:ribosomal protein S24E